MTGTIVRARCLLLIGPWAEVTLPERDYTDPVRVDAAQLASEVGVSDPKDLPGMDFEVTFEGTPAEPVLSGWRRV
ncbi:hypothetical protein ACOQFV_27405 [Nocardiopsis changdeensis]|uniref:Uncharacterized protein n=1 Tax=Nocardiopsis changdeensis TaxID=2831969 RepID=A0ABX8BLE1_9ACTN|nr:MULTISPECIES: hypothetical protein [Nocardiopsis]QUX22996.1 hypothetical protein KGD84_00865 [Nocardiopsis changdeensis]QYX38939.1 hypothetical protein K1J57_10315 [Nocardiopsis sp. MT53]